MQRSHLNAISLDKLIDQCVSQAQQQANRRTPPGVVVSPYRFNPLGAHIDHQGGSVLARCLDQYTILCFWPSDSTHSTHSTQSTLHSALNDGVWEAATFSAGQLESQYSWDAMARASLSALSDFATLHCGIEAVVFGTLISGGLSSSASVILAYLNALAVVNGVSLSAEQLVELVRRVENDYRGLNNGIQDQMSIAFGRKNHLVKLDMQSVSAQYVADAIPSGDVCFLMCYSGVSRDLTGSNFNTRVAQCQQAAKALDNEAKHLGEVAIERRGTNCLDKLPDVLKRRAVHVYSEMMRVEQGANAWSQGDWTEFGCLMNASCESSIQNYESGSPWLIDLHEMASNLSGVYGNRFSGGGYGGCLFMLADKQRAEHIAGRLLDAYLGKYPDKRGHAFVNIAQSESTVRVIDL